MMLVLLGAGASVPAMGQDWRQDLLETRGIETTEEAMREYLGAGVELDLEEACAALGSERYPERVKAQRKLIGGGRETLAWLAKQPESRNPEIRLRLGQIRDVLRHPTKVQIDRVLHRAVESLLAESGQGRASTGGMFYEWFGRTVDELPASYRLFDFVGPPAMGGAVTDGRLVLSGDREGDDDQRMILRASAWPGAETFPESFSVSADLRGTAGGAGAWHLGISVGKVRALFHPGFAGGAFRFEQVGSKHELSSNEKMGFTPSHSVWQRMSLAVRRLESGEVRLDVRVVQDGGASFQSTKNFSAEQIGRLDQIGLDRSGRRGGDAQFDDFLIEIAP